MPDRNTPNWTPDDAFWNEGWADMDRRLTTKRRRPLLLLLFLLGCVALAGTLVLWPSPSQPLSERSSPDPTEGRERIATPPEDSRTGNTQPDLVIAGDRSQSPNLQAFQPARVASPVLRSGLRSAKVTPIAPAPAATAVTDRSVQAYEMREAISATFLDTELYPLPDRLRNPLLQVAPPPVDTSSETAPFTALRDGHKFALSLGTNVYLNSMLPGWSAQAGYRLGSGKVFVPVALRYDYSRRAVEVNNSSEVISALGLNNYGNTSTNNLADFRMAVRSSGMNRVTAHSLELRTGIGIRLTDRLALSGGPAVHYLLGGRGPSVVSYVNSLSYSFVLEENRLNYGTVQADLANSPGGMAPPPGVPVDGTVNRWGVATWVGLDYRFGNRWSIGGGITHRFSRFYRENILRTERTGLEVRITKAL